MHINAINKSYVIIPEQQRFLVAIHQPLSPLLFVRPCVQVRTGQFSSVSHGAPAPPLLGLCSGWCCSSLKKQRKVAELMCQHPGFPPGRCSINVIPQEKKTHTHTHSVTSLWADFTLYILRGRGAFGCKEAQKRPFLSAVVLTFAPVIIKRWKCEYRFLSFKFKFIIRGPVS